MVLFSFVGVVAWIFRGAIAVRVMSFALEANLQADPLGDLEDGLHVTLCGAGGPLPGATRSGPCVAIVAGQKLYMVDAGSGAPRNLIAVGLQPPLVKAVFLTHFHSDHIDGLGELGVLRWAGGSHRRPLPVYGAEGVEEVLEGRVTQMEEVRVVDDASAVDIVEANFVYAGEGHGSPQEAMSNST